MRSRDARQSEVNRRDEHGNEIMTTLTRADGSRSRGFTLIELLIALAIVAILVRIAFPSYQAYIVRSSRQAAQSELVALANAQEKIFLNSNAYATTVTGPYTGGSTGNPTPGLGVSTGKSKDGRYTFSFVSVSAMAFDLKADPAGTPQAADGILRISETGARTGGPKGTW